MANPQPKPSARAKDVLTFFAVSALDMAELVLDMAIDKVKDRQARAVEARKRAATQQAQPRSTNGSGAHRPAAPKKKAAAKKKKVTAPRGVHPAAYAGPDRRGESTSAANGAEQA